MPKAYSIHYPDKYDPTFDVIITNVGQFRMMDWQARKVTKPKVRQPDWTQLPAPPYVPRVPGARRNDWMDLGQLLGRQGEYDAAP